MRTPFKRMSGFLAAFYPIQVGGIPVEFHSQMLLEVEGGTSLFSIRTLVKEPGVGLKTLASQGGTSASKKSLSMLNQHT